MKNLIYTAFFVLIVVFAPRLAAAQAQTAWQMAATPKPAPQAMWLDRNATPHQLTDLRGNVVVLNIWATWCQPCLAEMPTLDKLQRRYQKAGLHVVPVALDASGFERMDLFFRQAGIHHLPLLADPTGRLLGNYVQDSLPVTYIIDRQGLLLGTVTGAEDWFSDPVRHLLEQLLRNDDTAPPAETAQEEAPLILDVQP